jgi:hypothetical protein
MGVMGEGGVGGVLEHRMTGPLRQRALARLCSHSRFPPRVPVEDT